MNKPWTWWKSSSWVDVIYQWEKERKNPKYSGHCCPTCNPDAREGDWDHFRIWQAPMRILFDFGGDQWAMERFDETERKRMEYDRLHHETKEQAVLLK